MNYTKSFTRIPSRMFAQGTKSGVSMEAIKVFAGIQFLKTVPTLKTNRVKTTLIQLADECKFSAEADKEKVIKALEELEKAEYIKLDTQNIRKELIEISIIKLTEKIEKNVEAKIPFKSGVFNFKGYIKIEYHEFYYKNYKDFVIYLYVKLRQNIRDYRIPYKEWAYVLNVSLGTAYKAVNDCQYILKKTGKYKRRFGRLANQYELCP